MLGAAQRRADLGQRAELQHLRVGQGQVMGAGLGVDRVRAPAAVDLDHLERLAGADMDDIDRAIEHPGEAQDAKHRFRLGDAGARGGVVFRAGLALGDEPVLEEIAQIAVLGMDTEQAAIVLEDGEDSEDIGIAQIHAPLAIGHETLERAHPAVADPGNQAVQPVEVAGEQGAMEPEIDHRITGPLVDEIVHRIPQIAFDAPCLDGADIGNQRGDAAMNSRLRERIQAVGVDRMEMRLDNAGQHQFPRGVDGLFCGLFAVRRLDAVDDAVLDEDVAELHLAAVDQHAALDLDVADAVRHVRPVSLD